MNGPRRIWLLDRQGHNPQQVTTDRSEEVAHVAPAWSPDSKKIVFQNLARTKFDIRVVNLDSKQMNWVTNDFFTNIRPSWSPSGRFIYFSSYRSTTGQGGDFQPNWSPDEKRIAFFSSRAGSPNIWEVEIANGTLRHLTSNSGVSVNPFYSPDGRLIAYQSDQSGRLEVWIMNADGSKPRRLTNVGVTGHFMRWSADGSAIVFRCTCSGKPATMKVSVSGGDPQPFAEMMGCAPQKPRQFVKWINAGSNSSNFLPFVRKPVPFCAKLKLSCLDFKSPGDATSTPSSSSGNCCGMDCNL